MAKYKKGQRFYYDGESYSADEIIEIVDILPALNANTCSDEEAYLTVVTNNSKGDKEYGKSKYSIHTNKRLDKYKQLSSFVRNA